MLPMTVRLVEQPSWIIEQRLQLEFLPDEMLVLLIVDSGDFGSYDSAPFGATRA